MDMELSHRANKLMRNGELEAARELYLGDKCARIDVNCKNHQGTTPLHSACQRNAPMIVEVLLARRDIDVNSTNLFKETPFYVVCLWGNAECAKLLLEDPRTDTYLHNINSKTPFRLLSFYGTIDILKLWVASGRDLDKKSDIYTNGSMDKTWESGWQTVVDLFRDFRDDRWLTRHTLRKELGWYDERAATAFAHVVFLSDGLVTIRKGPRRGKRGRMVRFLEMAGKLPAELQAILCLRVTESSKNIIPGKEREAAFRTLARKLAWRSLAPCFDEEVKKSA
jgi:ankyrin repeat protein